MTRKRRKRPRAGTSGDGSRVAKPQPKEAAAATPTRLGPGVFPTFRSSMAGGIVAATASPVVIALPFVFVLLIWLGLQALGLEVFPAAMVQALAIPPVGSSFDFSAAATIYGINGAAFALIVGLTIVRSVIWSLLVGMLDEALEYRSVSLVGVLRGLRAFPAILVYDYLSFAIVLIGTFFVPVFLGSSIGQTSTLLSMIGGLFFLAFVPAAAVRLQLSPREAVARSSKAARLPGWPRHLLMVVVYFLLSQIVVFLSPGASQITNNPGIATWAFVLAGTFLNMVFLGALIHRWKAVEDVVPSQARRRR